MSDKDKQNKGDQDYEYQKLVYDYYIKQRLEKDRFALEISGRYEKFYMFITGGAFIGTLTFIETIAPNPIPYTKWIIGIAWSLLSLGMILSLWAIYDSQNAIDREIEILDIEQKKQMNPRDPRIQSLDTTKNIHVKKLILKNNLSLLISTLGLIFLIVFVIINY